MSLPAQERFGLDLGRREQSQRCLIKDPLDHHSHLLVSHGAQIVQWTLPVQLDKSHHLPESEHQHSEQFTSIWCAPNLHRFCEGWDPPVSMSQEHGLL